MHDAHFHLTERLYADLKRLQIPGIANAASKAEYLECTRKAEEAAFCVSAGIHPWYAEETAQEEILPCLEAAPIIGEIGLDRLWCSTPWEIQCAVFEKQLSYAAKHRKPVICHLKDAEREALPFLRRYPNTYLVHWYSCREHLEEYIALGCYFTVGPSVGRDPAVTQVASKVPPDRLLLESDGIGAVAWALGLPEEQVDYEGTLRRSLAAVAALRSLTEAEAEKQLDRNFRRFLSAMR